MATPDIITTLGNLTINIKKCLGGLPANSASKSGTSEPCSPSTRRTESPPEILTSDSRLGLRLTFYLLSSQAAIPIMRFMAHNRALSLLSVNIECRQLYISKFPKVLPLVRGKLRMRNEDILYVWNMGYLLYLYYVNWNLAGPTYPKPA